MFQFEIYSGKKKNPFLTLHLIKILKYFPKNNYTIRDEDTHIHTHKHIQVLTASVKWYPTTPPNYKRFYKHIHALPDLQVEVEVRGREGLRRLAQGLHNHFQNKCQITRKKIK